MFAMTPAKRRKTFLPTLCIGVALMAVFGMVGVSTQSPAGACQVIRALGSRGDAAVLADRLLYSESSDLVLDATRRDQLIQEIGQVLAQIRCAYPEIKDVSARPQPRVLDLGLESDLMEALSGLPNEDNGLVLAQTGHAEFDALNAALGLAGERVRYLDLFGSLLLEPGELVNLEAARRAYEEIPGVRYASIDRLIGDSPDIAVSQLQGTWYVIVRNAWGDCPSGCINREYHYFTVSNGVVSRVDGSQERNQFVIAFPENAPRWGL